MRRRSFRTARLRLLLTRSIRELVRAAQAGGVRFAPMQGLTDGMLRMLARMPLAIGQLLPQLMKLRMGATPNPGSTLQSIRHGQVTEIDYLNGAVVEAGDACGRRHAGESRTRGAGARGGADPRVRDARGRA